MPPQEQRPIMGDGLPAAAACYWHGAHYVGEACSGPPDDDEARDPSHCWHHAGCPDCDRRAAWIEAGRP